MAPPPQTNWPLTLGGVFGIPLIGGLLYLAAEAAEQFIGARGITKYAIDAAQTFIPPLVMAATAERLAAQNGVQRSAVRVFTYPIAVAIAAASGYDMAASMTNWYSTTPDGYRFSTGIGGVLGFCSGLYRSFTRR